MSLRRLILILVLGLSVCGANARVFAADSRQKRIWLPQADFAGKTDKWLLSKARVVAEGAPAGKAGSLLLAAGGYAVGNFAFDDADAPRATFVFLARGNGTLSIRFDLVDRTTYKWQQDYLGESIQINTEAWSRQEVQVRLPEFERAGGFLKLRLTATAGEVGVSGLEAMALLPDMAEAITRKKARLRATAAAMRVGAPSLSAATVKTYDKLEASFSLSATYDSPYNGDDIAVVGRIVTPAGKELRIPAFYYEGWNARDGMTRMELWVAYAGTGERCWKVRFTPTEPGDYTLQIEAKERSGRTASSARVPFTVTASEGQKGFVRISAENPMYFENSADGSLFWGTGVNVPWTRTTKARDPITTYEHYFSSLKDQASSTRVWLCHWAWLEWTPCVSAPGTTWDGYAGAGVYNQMLADSLDHVFQLAQDNHLRVMLVTEDNDEQMVDKESHEQWANNPYNRRNGGPCASPEEFFTHPEAIRLYQNRLRYILARWGYSTALWAINSCNDYSVPSPAVVRWIHTMRDYVHQQTDGIRPIIYGSNFRYGAEPYCDYLQGQSKPVSGKPSVIQECPFTENDQWFPINLHREIWNGLAGGMAAIMVWPHDTVDRLNCWSVFRPVKDFAQRFALNRPGWAPATVSVTAAQFSDESRCKKIITLRPYGDVPDWGVRSSKSRFPVDPSLTEQWLEGYGQTIYANRPDRINWRNPPHFLLDLALPGRAVLDVFEIGKDDQELEVRVNDSVALSRTLRHGRRYLQDEERMIGVDLPAGKVDLLVDATAGDWLRLHELHFILSVSRPEEVITAKGLATRTEGFVYVCNQTFNRLYKDLLKSAPQTAQEVALQVGGLQEGRYRVEALDANTLQVLRSEEVELRGGALPVKLERLESDAVIEFRKIQEGKPVR